MSKFRGISDRPGSRRAALMLTALLLVAANLRLGVTSASALLTALTDSGALTPTTVVLIPAIPTAIFAIAGFGTAWFARRLGVERTVLIALVVLAGGLLVRAVPQPWIVVLGTVIATAGLAIVNILLPAVVRAHFGTRIGPVTTAYTSVMALGSSLAASTAVPIASALGSPTLGLAAWAIPALIAIAAWLLFMPRDRPTPEARGKESGRRDRLPAGVALLTAYFALQALLSYVVMGWLPTIAHDAGIPPERSGMLLGVAMAVGIPSTFVVVSLAKSVERMRFGFVFIAIVSAIALTGLLVMPTVVPELWAVLLGIGMSAFPLVLALIASFGRDARQSAVVSTIVQSVGYSIATLGPLGAGALRQATGSWTVVIVVLALAAVTQGVIGVLLTRVIRRRKTQRP